MKMFSKNLIYPAYILFSLSLLLISFTNFIPEYFIYFSISISWLGIILMALKDFKKKKFIAEFFLAFATILSIIGSQENAIAIVLIIMLVARYFEFIIEQRTEKSLFSLIKLIPTDVTIIEDKEEKTIKLKDVTPGMKLIVKGGQRIPTDGLIIDGFASINESALTGESKILDKGTGFSVFAGTFIEAGTIIIKITAVSEETLFGKITKLLLEAEKKRTQITKFADKFAIFFVIFFSIFVAFIWLFTKNLNIVITLLIFGTPLEFILATPLTVLSATIAAFRKGILIKGGLALELFAKIKIMIFDKTGTLTLGEPRVVNLQITDPTLDEEDFIRLIAIAEKRSEHVLSKAIILKAQEYNLDIPNPEKYIQVIGHGVEITYNNKKYFLGSRHFIETEEHANIKIPEIMECKHEKGHSIFYLANEKQLLGKICLADQIRPNAKKIIKELEQEGIKQIILLSGDRQEITDTIANQIGIKEALGDFTPDKKLLFLQNLQKNSKVAMVGDGINDAPALKIADVGIAMGAMGMEPAIEAADIVLMTNELSKIVFLKKLAKKLLKTIKQNLIFGFAIVHILGVVLALFNLLIPVEAAFFHAVTDILILLNSIKLMGFKS